VDYSIKVPPKVTTNVLKDVLP
jgi:uncharacterized membrane protein YheB (UPF0754 family)